MSDTTETYIKMCDCPEIQESPVFTDDVKDWLYCTTCNLLIELDEDGCTRCWCDNPHSDKWEGHWVWLPRQDQLQEMVGNKGKTFTHIHDFEYGVNTPEYSLVPALIFLSMEQLWLAFVMKELYQKRWSGSEWK